MPPVTRRTGATTRRAEVSASAPPVCSAVRPVGRQRPDGYTGGITPPVPGTDAPGYTASPDRHAAGHRLTGAADVHDVAGRERVPSAVLAAYQQPAVGIDPHGHAGQVPLPG